MKRTFGKNTRFRYFYDDTCDYVLSWIVVDTRRKDKCYINACKKDGLDWEHSVKSYAGVATFASEEDAENYCNMLNENSAEAGA